MCDVKKVIANVMDKPVVEGKFNYAPETPLTKKMGTRASTKSIVEKLSER